MTESERHAEAVRRVEARRKAEYDAEVFAEEQVIINGENLQLLTLGLGRYADSQRAEREQATFTSTR